MSNDTDTVTTYCHRYDMEECEPSQYDYNVCVCGLAAGDTYN